MERLRRLPHASGKDVEAGGKWGKVYRQLKIINGFSPKGKPMTGLLHKETQYEGPSWSKGIFLKHIEESQRAYQGGTTRSHVRLVATG